ncbi:TPA: Dot/Icm T4SS effector AnkC/LegA12 [Legionella feeleii]|uniref:Ankyrin repeat protein n=1 Tax=Legionella feeleii TaxID=453 RepID=A0A378IRE6_9GAMM|nr:Dot/Icm T4SS effector AnkC/LegA12 [Legionella feeleii]STX37530.1 ankyrin repeat protein [Legionella feeleii]
MHLLDKIDQILARKDEGGLEAFKELILEELKTKPKILRHIFCLRNGAQTTILNRLIRAHDAVEHNLTEYIRFLFEQGASAHVEEPVHLAFQLGKPDLGTLVLEHAKKFVEEPTPQQLLADSYDPERKTLLARAIDTGNIDNLRVVLDNHPNVNKPSEIQVGKDKKISIPPLHQAIIKNFTGAVDALIKAGADVDNTYGALQETPLLLAARLGRVDALKTILESKAPRLDLEATNEESNRAIDLLCARLDAREDPQGALRGIAMLLCHGAAVPQEQAFCTLLQDNRYALLDEVSTYTEKLPELAASFVRRCHISGPLHSIIYAENSWWQSLWYLFARPSHVALQLESLVLRGQPAAKKKEAEVEAIDEAPGPFTKEEVQFATFVKKYEEALSIKKFLGITIFNPWSSMRWAIDSGKFTSLEQVKKYRVDYPGTRTERVLEKMEKRRESLHEDLDGANQVKQV